MYFLNLRMKVWRKKRSKWRGSVSKCEQICRFGQHYVEISPASRSLLHIHELKTDQTTSTKHQASRTTANRKLWKTRITLLKGSGSKVRHCLKLTYKAQLFTLVHSPTCSLFYAELFATQTRICPLRRMVRQIWGLFTLIGGKFESHHRQVLDTRKMAENSRFAPLPGSVVQSFGLHMAFVAEDSTKQNTVNSPPTDTLVSGQLYIRTLFSIPVFTSQSNSVFTHSRKRTLSRKRTRTLLKMESRFFRLLRSLVSAHPTYCINWLLRQSNRSVGIGFLKLSVRLLWHQERVSVAIFGSPNKT